MEFTKKELLTFSIYELRCIGKDIGVKAPTSLVKADLVDAIINVQSGLVKPYVAKRGRPSIVTPKEKILISKAKINVIEIIDRVLEKVKEELIAEFCEDDKN